MTSKRYEILLLPVNACIVVECQKLTLRAIEKESYRWLTLTPMSIEPATTKSFLQLASVVAI